MSISQMNSVFTVSSDLILTEKNLPYDLYINSSAREGYDRFVCIFKHGRNLSRNELQEIKQRYSQIYIREDERGRFLKAMTSGTSGKVNDGAQVEQKARIIKDSAINYIAKLFDKDHEVTSETVSNTLLGCRDTAESLVHVIRDAKLGQLQELIGKLSFHDFYTYDHSVNVGMYNMSIYRMLRPEATERELVIAGLGGLLHDIGKINLPTNLINNPFRLTDRQFLEIKRHPGWGQNMLEPDAVHCYGVNKSIISKVIYQHHENFDGSGYPNNIRGEDIHILARITAISDFFDAITTVRSYHKALDSEEALNMMATTAGKKIDPNVFEIFAKSMRDLYQYKIDAKYPKTLPTHYDACQPQYELPWIPHKHHEIHVHNDEKKNYGAILHLGIKNIEKENVGKVVRKPAVKSA